MGLPFMKSRARKRDQIIAIDLGGRSSKAVHLQRKGDNLTLVNYAVLDAASHDKAISQDVLTEHLKEIGRLLNVRAKHVTVALGVNDTVFKQAEVPIMSPADLRQMLKYSTKNYLQQELQDYVFDCHYVLSAQYLLDQHRRPIPGQSSSCRTCLTLASRYLGGSAACLTGTLGLFSLRSCAFFTSRTHRSGSTPSVRPFAAVRSGYYGLG